MKGFVSAIRTLTSFPVTGREGEEIASSIPWFPVVGLALGLILFGIGHVCTLFPFGRWDAGGALLMVGAGIWLTRGLHLDGLADWADSIGGYYDRDKRLAIMKDVYLGAFGVLALILVLTAKWIAFERLLSSGTLIWIPVVFVISRGMMAELITTLPYARKIDQGMAGPFIEGASGRHRLISLFLSLVFTLPFGPLGPVFFGLAALMTWLFKRRCRYRFGGITGDLLGTANEMVEVSLLFICALPGKSILCYTGWTWLF